MPRTSAYNQSLNPDRPGQPLDGWDHITIVDQQTGRVWDYSGAYQGNDAPVPLDLEHQRDRATGFPNNRKLG